MDKPRGFTLIELLVVISIIALLLAILMPALTRVRKQGRATVCQANLKNWGLICQLYTGDNNGYFCKAKYWGGYWMWLEALRPYYKDPKLRICPSATKLFTEGGEAPFAAWIFAGDDGSYGINGYVYNPAPETHTLWGHPVKWCWRNINQKGGNNIPMFLDANVLNGGPLETDEPPQYAGDIGADWYNHIRRFFANRHERHQNAVFLDCSVRKVGCKELYKLKWHREFDINGPWTIAGGVTPSDWPDWLEGLKDY